MSIFGNNSAALSSILAAGGITKNEFTAGSGQTEFMLSFVLQASSAVFINGSIIESSEYSGTGTDKLTLSAPLLVSDKVVVIK
jgi:hypothetical protein